VTDIEVVFEERSATGRVESLPLSHLSIELGHLYMEDFAAGPGRLREMFEAVAPWAGTAREVCAAGVRPKTPRVSTCFLIDDYFTAFSSPGEVVPMVAAAAEAAGVRLDYLAREAACAEVPGVPLASMVVKRLVADPPPGTDGTRPPTDQTGWVCNGSRTPYDPVVGEAMRPGLGWQPPSENGANRHSIFVDVELWDEPAGRRQWSCALLAAVWQLLRLGVLRYQGQPVVVPRECEGPYPERWADLPPLTRLNPHAAPFSAYRTFSVLGGRFLPTEQAVRTILSQVAIEPAVASQIVERAGGEKLTLPREVIDRIEYAFVGEPWSAAGPPAATN
jgi:hypothetical protein